jgi:Bromodomain
MPSNSSGTSTLSIAQFRFCQSTVRNLKKLKDAVAFLRPVDPVALGIPHYPSVIKNPMDFSTIDRKLTASNPNKPDPNPSNPRYTNAEDFVSDVRLIFSNCITFNGPEHAVSVSGKRVEEIFDKQIKNMPAPLEVSSPILKIYYYSSRPTARCREETTHSPSSPHSHPFQESTPDPSSIHISSHDPPLRNRDRHSLRSTKAGDPPSSTERPAVCRRAQKGA